VHLKVLNPFNQAIISELPFDQRKTLEKKIADARARMSYWRRLSLKTGHCAWSRV
jgi:acyl-CoA reductase-like NAD-dependent aldehyde dehydrogenase